MNLIVDIGNTKIKIAYFDNHFLNSIRVLDSVDDFNEFIKKAEFEKSIICSVRDLGEFNVPTSTLIFDHQTKIPIENNYETPKTLGLDRLAAVIGAQSEYKNQDILVIDCGSCITYDYLSTKKGYLGGGITTGLNMKLKALHNFTDKLPLVNLQEEFDLIGTTTEKSILSGVINGTIAEISGIIQEYRNISDNLAPVLCGGDSEFIKNRLNLDVVLDENLVLKGLNEVLRFNE